MLWQPLAGLRFSAATAVGPCSRMCAAAARHLLARCSTVAPADRHRSVPSPDSRTSPEDWRELDWPTLLRQRGWLHDKTSTEAETDAALRQLSCSLSFPLTLAHAWDALGITDVSRPINVCILGARAEALVPMSEWLELCVLTSTNQVQLLMIGPEAEGEARGLELGGRSITQAAPCSSIFTHSPLAAAATPDVFVLYNPGLHTGKYTWRPTMEAVLATGAPVLLTGYSAQDVASDANWLASMSRRLKWDCAAPSYEVNPWACLEPWQGSYANQGVADAYANQFITVVNGRGPCSAAGNPASPRARAPAHKVKTETGWARKSDMGDLFTEIPRVLFDAIRDMRGLPK